MKNLKEFNLERALSGDLVVTRDGKSVTEIHYFKTASEGYPVVAIIDGMKFCYQLDGKNSALESNEINLFMAPIKKKGWIKLDKKSLNVSGLYKCEGDAIDACRDNQIVIEIEWE